MDIDARAFRNECVAHGSPLPLSDSEAERHSKRSDPSLGSGPEPETVEPQACRDA
jgi:hypothetical protein